ncbi:MAG: DotA/TraY family protein [Tabrizicola sp.]|nr:DotA/TraY family protein [Tabrizicola sp.]
MEFDELFQPADGSSDYSAGLLTRIFGSIIPRLHATYDGSAVGGTNWLESIFLVFNTLMLLGMLVVLSYTIYAMIFDTAADGQTFGQSTDTKYTVLRTVIGVIGFVPISGGYSLAQVAFLWLVLQGSALADTTWRVIAERMLDGTPLVSGTINTVPPRYEARLAEFGGVFDAMVTGHLCGINANAIAMMLSGTTDLTPAMVSTQSGAGGPIRYSMIGPVEVASESWAAENEGSELRVYTATGRFGETAGGASYGGTELHCGSVRMHDHVILATDGTGGVAGTILQARKEAVFNAATSTILDYLSVEAHRVAMAIYLGERDQEAILAPSRDAVYTALQAYMSAAPMTDSLDDSAVGEVHDFLVGQVTQQGWMLAPVWQRGVATTVSNLEQSADTLTITIVRENRITDFLAGRGYRVDRPGVPDLLAQADSNQDRWDEIAGIVRGLPLPDAARPVTVSLGGTPNRSEEVAFGYYKALLDFFSPVEEASATGGFVDPMLQVQRQGSALAYAGTIPFAAGVGVTAFNGSFAGRIANFFTGSGEATAGVASGLVTMGLAMTLTGFAMQILIPLVPMAYFFSGVVNWLAQIMEGMFAIPLATLRMFAPAREANLIGNMQSVLLTVLGVFLRPFFMLAGLVLAMMLISVALTYLHQLFSTLLFFVTVGDTSVTAGSGGIAAVISAGGDMFWGLIQMLFFMFIYVSLAFMTVLYGSQIITEFGDFALQLLGAQVSRYSQAGAIADRSLLGGGALGYGAARGLTSGVGQGVARRLGTGNQRMLKKGAGAPPNDPRQIGP